MPEREKYTGKTEKEKYELHNLKRDNETISHG